MSAACPTNWSLSPLVVRSARRLTPGTVCGRDDIPVTTCLFQKGNRGRLVKREAHLCLWCLTSDFPTTQTAVKARQGLVLSPCFKVFWLRLGLRLETNRTQLLMIVLHVSALRERDCNLSFMFVTRPTKPRCDTDVAGCWQSPGLTQNKTHKHRSCEGRKEGRKIISVTNC